MNSEDALMFGVARPKKSSPSSRPNMSFPKEQHYHTLHQSQATQPRLDRFPLQDASALGNAATYSSYRDSTVASSDSGTDSDRWHSMSMDCEVSDENDHHYSHTTSHAPTRPAATARMGLPASYSAHSVSSSVASESSCEDESELSRSLESTGYYFPVTPARGTYSGRLPMFESDDTLQQDSDDVNANKRRSSGLNCSPRSGTVLPTSLLFRDPGYYTTSVSPRSAASTTAACKNVNKIKMTTNAPITASPLSPRVNLPHIGEEQQSSGTNSPSSKGSETTTCLGSSPARLSISGPSNLAARRKLPSLAISGVEALTTNAFKSTMPHTPGGSVFKGARDGAATGDDTPVSPFLPPTPLVVARGDKDRSCGYLSTPARTIAPANRKPSSLPDVHGGYPSSPLRRQGSLGPLSPLSRDFAAVSVGSSSVSQCSSTYTTSSSQESANTSRTTLTPPMSPLGAYAGNFSEPQTYPRSPSSSALGAARPKLLKSKSANRVTPYPNREFNAADVDLTKSSPGKLSEAKSAINALRLSPVSPTLKSQTMEKSLSAPLQQAAEPKTVSGKTLSTRSLHPVFAASYTLGDELGSGGFGFVVGAHRNFDGRPVAVKFIWKNKVPTHGWVRDPTLGVIPLEAFVLRVVDHPCVVKFIDLFDDEEFFYLVMEMHGTPWKAPDAEEAPSATEPNTAEISPVSALPSPEIAVFAPGSVEPTGAPLVASPTSTVSPLSTKTSGSKAGLAPPRPAPMERRTSRDLFECIEQHTRFSEDVAAWIFAQIVEAVYYLGQLGICHRDIKDENCVIDSEWNVKIIDFGSAVISDPRKPAPYFDRFFGTMTFASSEILQGRQYRAPHAEVWSLGVLLSILLSGECPFSEPSAAVKGRISSRVKNSWSPEAYNLLCGCVQVEPDRRATIAQVRDHPWVKRAWERKGLRRPSAPQIF